MLEELIEEYIKAKQRYESLKDDPHTMMPLMKAQSDYSDAVDNLLDFIEKHSDTLISWERQNALRTSPFDDLG